MQLHKYIITNFFNRRGTKLTSYFSPPFGITEHGTSPETSPLQEAEELLETKE